MTINVISDLHCKVRKHADDMQLHNNWCDFEPEKLEAADVLVVAGDLAESHGYPVVKAELEQLPQFKHVICIRGNHDYWGIGHGVPYPEENEVRVIDDVAFICTPLWTPIPMTEEQNPNHLAIRWAVEDCMNDFRFISGWSSEVQNEQYSANLSFIVSSIKEQRGAGNKVVIVTHTVPRRELIDERFEGQLLNYAFHVMDGSCDYIKPDLWICGHAHNFCDETLDGVRYIRNPIGYRWGWQELPDDHWYNTVVEV